MSASAGMPAPCSIRTASAPMMGVCGAGFAMTVLPAAKAAETCPRKMASGKFQGAMHRNGPRPCT